MAYLKNNDRGIRAIVWSHANQRWSSVAKANRGRSMDGETGTYQIIEKGDLLLIGNNGRVYTRLFVDTADDDQGTISLHGAVCTSDVFSDHQVNLSNVMLAYDATINDWLLNPETGDFLPAGYGWDGSETLYDIRKRGKITSLIWDVKDELLKRAIVDAAVVSPFRNVPTNWDEAVYLPLTDGDHVLTVQTNADTELAFVILWDRDYNVTINKRYESLGEVNHKVKIPPETFKAMVGTISRKYNNAVKTASWTLYRR